MPINRSNPVRFTPRGLVDAFDATDIFAGACRALKNLIFDQANPELLVSRPGVGDAIADFPPGSFVDPQYVSVHIVIGDMCYGMVACDFSGTFRDQPFAFNLLTNTFIFITGITAANCPLTQPTTGEWTPPTMAMISTKIIVTHPGFSGTGSNFFGVLDVSSPGVTLWSSSNTSPTLLPKVPTAVTNFGNRAYFAVGNVSYFTDVLLPTTMTNATQQLTHGDTTPIVGYGGLPVATTSGGIIQALIVFKRYQIWQVTGDQALQNLAQNYISLNVGCVAARTIVQTPLGTFFIALDGPYLVDSAGGVRPLTRDSSTREQDLQIPFQNSVNSTDLSTRMAAGFSGDIYRICLNTVIEGEDELNDYWFSANRLRWTGPHSFPADCLSPYNNAFVISHRDLGAKLYLAQTFAASDSIYVDEGQFITCQLQTSTFPKRGTMHMNSIVESMIELSSSGAQVIYLLSFLNEQFGVLNQAQLQLPTGGGLLWGGGGTWGGGGIWSSFASIPKTYGIPWTAPIVFQKGALQVDATANASLLIGTSYFRYEDLGYMNQENQ